MPANDGLWCVSRVAVTSSLRRCRRGTHLFVSLPLLYGPLAAVLFLHAARLVTRLSSWLMSWIRRPNSEKRHARETPSLSNAKQANRRADGGELNGAQATKRSSEFEQDDWASSPFPLVLQCLLPVLVFSANPHQEPRFLLPLGILLAVLGGHCGMSASFM